MKKNGGFTLLEVALVTVILGIIGGFTLLKFLNTNNSEHLQKAANNLYLELRGLRPLCFRYDETVMVIFDASNNKLNIYIDQNDDETIQETELHTVFELPSPVEIGVCETAPDSWVYDQAPTNGLAENWIDTLIVVADSRGEYSHGGVYLNVPGLKKITYFIGITTSMQSLELYKWTGSTWVKL